MMGTNGVNMGGGGNNELGGMMAGHAGSNHPPATEYTLQGKHPLSLSHLAHNIGSCTDISVYQE